MFSRLCLWICVLQVILLLPSNLVLRFFGSSSSSNTSIELESEKLEFHEDKLILSPNPSFTNSREWLLYRERNSQRRRLRSCGLTPHSMEYRIPNTMNVPTTAQRLPLLNARAFHFLSLPLRGASKFGSHVPILCHSRRVKVGSSNKMALSLENCDVGVENKLGVVRPATEHYAKEAIQSLKAEKVIVVPTDTIYGFACDACSMEAVNRIYKIKGREHTRPLAICVGDVSDILRFAVTDYLPQGLLDSLLPGPVTVVLRRGESSILEKSLNPGLDSIGVRVPDCNFIRAIARGLGSALALTSANLSGQPSSVCIKDFENLWQHCAFVYDGGVLPSGRAGSTIVDLTRLGKYKIIRPGSANEETIAILERHSLLEETTAT